MTIVIFVDVLDHTEADDEGEREREHWVAARVRDGWDAFHDCKDKEVQVGHLRILLHQVQGNESKAVVAGSHDFV